MIICESDKCSGCCACYNVCNNQAITMTENEWGYIHPVVDEKRCTHCGACVRMCPEHYRPNLNVPTECYAMYSPYKEDLISSSGGAATILGRCIIQKSGVVFGTVYDKDGTLVYDLSRTEFGLGKFRGSKYVYAYPGTVYRQIQELLFQGIPCLFVGTPCHVAGLRTFLKKDWSDLYTVDLICHGTPPMTYLRQHIKNVTCGRHVSKVAFRGKYNYYFSAYEGDQRIYLKRANEDTYFSIFMNSLAFRESCYQCAYAQPQRVGDLTIGDFWGLGTDALGGYPGKTSVILVNTEKGKSMLSWIQDVAVVEQRTVQEAIQCNHQLSFPTTRPPQREVFLSAYLHGGFSEAVRHTDIPNKIRKAKLRNILVGIPRYIRSRITQRIIQSFMRQE